MFKTTMLAGASAIMLALPSMAQSQALIEDLEVTLDVSAIENAKAAAYWANLPADLEAAILIKLHERLTPAQAKGMSISVDLDEVELATTLESMVGSAESKLAGKVRVSGADDPAMNDSYEMFVTVEQAALGFAEPTKADPNPETIARDADIYYPALINGFAEVLVKRLVES